MSSSKLAAGTGMISLLKSVASSKSKLAAAAGIGLIVLLKLIISSSSKPSSAKPASPIKSDKEKKGQHTDLISQLPDDILTSILFFLPLTDCARTSVLSSRWRHVWRHSALHLDDSSQSQSTSSSSDDSLWPMDDLFSINPYEWNIDNTSFENSLSAGPHPLDQPHNSRFYLILSSHHGPVHSLRLSGVKGLVFRGTVTHLITRVIHRNIRELTLDFLSVPKSNYHYELPVSLYNCKSLQSLTLTKCRFPKHNPTPLRSSVSVFPNLKELNLMRCSGLGVDLFEAVLMSCKSLEIVQLISCEAGSPGLGRITVSSASLRKFVLCNNPGRSSFLDITELIVEDAPNLECLMLSSNVTKSCGVRVRCVTKLRVLGFVSAKFKRLQLGGNYLVPQPSESTQTSNLKVTPNSAAPTLSTVKTLAIDICSARDYGGMIVALLGCFPCIENLYISGRCNSNQKEDPAIWGTQETLKLLQDLRLKRVVIYGFHGDDVLELELVRFLVAKVKVLDEIIIIRDDRQCNITHQERVRIERGLGFGKRASKRLKLNFSSEAECTSHVSLWKPLKDYKFVSF